MQGHGPRVDQHLSHINPDTHPLWSIENGKSENSNVSLYEGAVVSLPSVFCALWWGSLPVCYLLRQFARVPLDGHKITWQNLKNQPQR